MVQQEQHQSRPHHERRENRRSDQLQVLGRNPVQGWYQYRRGPNKYGNGDRSDGRTKKIVDKQFYQLPHQLRLYKSLVVSTLL
ncbi:hypothetical protein DPMN_156368 [Dreissena polymorpha]|uniref:Uncharacterized protein n=1 Tax=Dreissena polymorpha TaxID=45954 RepID=A0A9D4FNW8_DREPO|nr:hypothetical protein DPMN_156368 [Dreissena polymorpha]